VKRQKATRFTPGQARAFVSAMRDKRWGAAYLVAIALGLREGELLGLKWREVDLEKRTLTVSQTVERVRREEGEGSSLQFCETKTASSRRTLYLSPWLVAFLRLIGSVRT